VPDQFSDFDLSWALFIYSPLRPNPNAPTRKLTSSM
jgi:hypothetical protein